MAPEHFEAWYSLAKAYYATHQDQYKGHAHEALDHALALNPDDPYFHHLMGKVRYEMFDNPDEAIMDFTRAIEINPEPVEFYNSRGVVYLETGQWELCIPDYNEFIARDPQNPWAYLERGDCYAGLGTISLARVDYEVFLELTKSDSGWENQISRVNSWLSANYPLSDTADGRSLWEQADEYCWDELYYDCIEYSYQALDADYEYPMVYNSIGYALLNLSMLESALAPLDKAIDLDQTYPWAFLTRGRVKLELGDLEGALEDLISAYDMNPDNHAMLYNVGKAYFLNGLMDEAVSALDRALEIKPEAVWTRTLRAEVLWNGFDDFDGAMEELDQAISYAESYDGYPYSIRGYIFLETGQFDLCINDYNTTISRDPERYEGYKYRGDCYIGKGDLEAARADYEQFMLLSEGNPEWEIIRVEVQTWLDSNP
jgi:tetratricopeptide (TPR) repeat protein